MRRRRLFVLFVALTAVVIMVAQPIVRFNNANQNMGYVMWKQPITITYQLKNEGDKPLVISRVTTSCGCTTATWTETPIPPGGSGQVIALFDAASIGQFYKEVGIYSNAASMPLYVSFEGEVIPPGKELPEQVELPYQIGNIGLDKEEIIFDSIYKGTKPVMEINVVNNSPAAYAPYLMHLPPYLNATMTPELLGKGRTGKIYLTLDTEKVPKLGITTTSIYLARFSGDQVGSENEIPVSIVLFPALQHASYALQGNPPAISLSATELNFGEVRLGQKKTQTIYITNTGRSKLTISEMQMLSIALTVKLGKRELRPGESTKMKVTLIGENLPRVKKVPRILMITNDPKRPQVTIRAKANLSK